MTDDEIEVVTQEELDRMIANGEDVIVVSQKEVYRDNKGRFSKSPKE